MRLRAGFGHSEPRDRESGSSPYRRRTIRPNGTPDWHILIIIEGKFVTFHDQKQEVHLSPGQAILYQPHATQDYMLREDHESGKTFWTHFFPEVSMMPFLKWPTTKSGTGVMKWEVNSELHHQILNACERCVSYLNSTMYRNRSLSLLALEEMLRLLHQVHPDAVVGHLDDRVATALQFIASNINKQLTTESISNAVGLSPSRLSHIFSLNMDCSIMDYIGKQRINLACRLLSDTILPISLIAEKCGFSSAYYFSARFRKMKDLSPSEYRKIDRRKL